MHEVTVRAPTRECAEIFIQHSVNRILRAMESAGGGVIWWRIRFQTESMLDGDKWIWPVYARLGTSPELAPEFWSNWPQIWSMAVAA